MSAQAPHARLQTEVDHLRELLAEVIAVVDGAAARQRMEKVAALALARRAGTPGAHDGLCALVSGLGPAEMRGLVRGFSVFFDLVNLAEDRQRIRVLRERERARHPAPQAESVAAAIGEMRARGTSLPRGHAGRVYTATGLGNRLVKYASKKEFIDRIEREHECFVALAELIPARRYREPGVWGEDWTIKDLFAHLTEWEQMCLGWHREGQEGRTPAMPAEGYKWNETARLNGAIWKKHRRTSWPRIRAAFDRSYDEILTFARSLSERELLAPGHFAWTKTYPLTTYLGANTCSHYSAAMKILKRWRGRNG